MSIIDFHSHILPGIDDGSKNIETSLNLLKEASTQQVDVMVATPHFYAQNESIDDFIIKRNQSYKTLLSVLPENSPQILLGTEVSFFKGISEAERIDSLLIENSNILLLEMPFNAWKASDVEEVKRMIKKSKLQIMLAHLERFMKISENKQFINELLELPVIVQINAASMLDWGIRRKAIKLFKKHKGIVLGSDCHNMHSRPQNLLEGRTVLKNKLGEETIREMDILGTELLSLDKK